MRRPAFFLALAILAGAVVGRIVLVPVFVAAILGLALIVGAVWLAHKGRRPEAVGAHDSVRALVVAAVFVLGLFQQNEVVRGERQGDSLASRLEKMGNVTLRATVADEAVVRDRRVTILLRDVDVAAAPRDRGIPVRRLPRRALLSLVGRAEETWRTDLPVRGQRMEIQGTLKPLEPGPSADMFDYGNYLRKQGIGGEVVVRGPQQIRRVPVEDSKIEASIFGVLMHWRRGVTRLLEVNLSPSSAGVMRAMLLGDMSGLDARSRDIFARVGASHIFSVSGLHTAFLAFAIFCVFRLLQISPRPAAWITLILLALYCAMVGFLSPVVRSAIMTGCLMIPYIARRAVDSLNALAVAAFLAILFNPLAPFQTDFQFSYLCVFGLIVLTPALNEVLQLHTSGRSRRLQRIFALYNHGIAQGLSVSLASQLAVLPLLTVYYHQVSIIALVANLVLVPLSSVLLAAGWLLCLLGPLSAAAAHGLGIVTTGLCDLFLAIGGIFALPSWASILTPSLPWWLICAYCLVIFTGPHLAMRDAPGQLQTRRARLGLRLAAVAALLAWWGVLCPFVSAPGEATGDLKFTMIDVGQGDSLLLENADGNVILVDAGPRSASRRVREYLSLRNIPEISALVLTHGDSDHAGGAADLLENVRVQRLLCGPPGPTPEPLLGEIRRIAGERGIPVVPISRGDRLRGITGTEVDVINPPVVPSGAVTSNEASVVLRIAFGEVTFLLTGDAEARVEADLLAAFGSKDMKADVLKVGHHGSNGGSTPAFVHAVAPEIALLSVGAHNPYHHPSPSVVARLEEAGSETYSTAVDGIVEIQTDGRRLWIRSSRGSKNSCDSASGGPN